MKIAANGINLNVTQAGSGERALVVCQSLPFALKPGSPISREAATRAMNLEAVGISA